MHKLYINSELPLVNYLSAEADLERGGAKVGSVSLQQRSEEHRGMTYKYLKNLRSSNSLE